MNNPKIKTTTCGYNNSIIHIGYNQILFFGSMKYHYIYNKPELITLNSPIRFIMNEKIDRSWTPDNHNIHSVFFRKGVLTFLLFLFVNHLKTDLKIPKFVIYEIIKKIDSD